MQKHILYAVPFSLYSGKARSYLIKAEIRYREISPANAHYQEQVLPKAGGPSIPAIELRSRSVTSRPRNGSMVPPGLDP